MPEDVQLMVMMQASYGNFLVPEDLGPGVDKYPNFHLQEVKVLARSFSSQR